MSLESQASTAEAMPAASGVVRAQKTHPLFAMTFRGFAAHPRRYVLCLLTATAWTALLTISANALLSMLPHLLLTLSTVTLVGLLSTVAIVTAQFRQMDLSPLRNAGVHDGAIARVIAGQSMLLGIVGAGVGVGLGRAVTLLAIPLPVSSAMAPVGAFVTGIVVTVLAAVAVLLWPPASDDRASHSYSLVVPTIVGAALVIIGAGLLSIGKLGVVDWSGTARAFGVVICLLGSLLVLPALCRPLIAILSWPLRLVGRSEARLASRELSVEPVRWSAFVALAFLATTAVIALRPLDREVPAGLMLALLILTVLLLVTASGVLAERVQKQGELELLAALGLSPGALTKLVVFEAVLAAVAAALVGVVAGLGIAAAVY